MPCTLGVSWRYSGTIVAIDAGGETIEATAGHPFWVVSGESLALRPAAHELGTPISRGGRWVESDDLRVGDKLLTRDGSQLAVTAIRTTQEWVYNLTVRRTHTYSVGSVGVLVHNSCIPKDAFTGKSAASRAFEHLEKKMSTVPLAAHHPSRRPLKKAEVTIAPFLKILRRAQ